jgi:ATP phosphoribosyltransferase
MIRDSDSHVLRIGLPKGSLQDSTIDLFGQAGYAIRVTSRSYFPTIDDPDLTCVMFRAQEMSRYVEDGVIDLGITGHDWVIENNSDVVEVCELKYSKATTNPARWVLAVPEESDIKKPEDLAGGIVATELLETTKRYFADRNIEVKTEFSWGATEVKARLVSGIVDVTETGSSLRANKLRVLDDILTSTTRLIANKDAWNDSAKREKIEHMAMLLKGAMDARSKVGLKMNVPAEKLDTILALLPAEQSPTVNKLQQEGWHALEIIVDYKIERELAPKLHKEGATGIISYPLSKVIH